MSNESALTCSHIEYQQEPYPYLLPLVPNGLGTGDVEALTSYFCRQAEQTMMLAHAFSHNLLLTTLGAENLPKNIKQPDNYLHAFNGIGALARRHIEALTNASEGKIDARMLTMMPLAPASETQARGLLKNSRHWCNQCWIQDLEAKRTPYTRLYWCFKDTSVCIHHECRLTSQCPACDQTQKAFPRFPRQWICDQCGEKLYAHDSAFKAEEFTNEEAWKSMSLHNLIDRIQRERPEIPDDAVQKALKRILAGTHLNASQFTKKLDVDYAIINRMLLGHNTLLPVILDLCYRMDIPIDQFLFDKDILSEPSHWRQLPRPKFSSHARMDKKHRTKVATSIKKMINENPNPPQRLSHIANKLNTTVDVIRYHFPDELKILSQRYSSWQRDENRNQHTERLEKLCAGIFSLARRGVYPSTRKLHDLELVIPSDLRREDVKTLLKPLQEIYSELEQR